jgi:hypothetical protein
MSNSHDKIHKIIRNREYVNKIKKNIQARINIRNVLKHEKELSTEQVASVFSNYASSEIIAHSLVSKLATEINPGNATYEILDSDGEIRQYSAKKIMTKNRGLVGFFLMPVLTDNTKIHVVFKGTSNTASIIRDLEYGGAGAESFAEESEGILQQINGWVRVARQRNGNQKTQLAIHGHSLGGADAQNCSAVLIKAMAQNVDSNGTNQSYENKLPLNIRNNLQYVNSLSISHINSAGVSKKVALECERDANFLAHHAKGSNKINVSLHALHVNNDIVQKSGQASILSDVDANVAHVEMLHVEHEHDWDYNSANLLQIFAHMLFYGVKKLTNVLKKNHCAYHFKDENNKCKMEYYANSTPEGRKLIKQNLMNKSPIENSVPITFFKAVLKGIMLKMVN